MRYLPCLLLFLASCGNPIESKLFPKTPKPEDQRGGIVWLCLDGYQGEVALRKVDIPCCEFPGDDVSLIWAVIDRLEFKFYWHPDLEFVLDEPDVPHLALYLGGRCEDWPPYGVIHGIYHNDRAIVFEQNAPCRDPESWTRWVANLCAHEIGHHLNYEHTEGNYDDLMAAHPSTWALCNTDLGFTVLQINGDGTSKISTK